jgi:hypothetical protein
LFIIATADITKALQNEGNVKFYTYADDMVLIAKSVEILRTAFSKVTEWATKNELLLNRKKTVMMTFKKGGRRANTDRIFYGKEPLELVTEVKHFGIIFQMNGRNFTNHVRERAAAVIAALHGIKNQPIVNDDCNDALRPQNPTNSDIWNRNYLESSH